MKLGVCAPEEGAWGEGSDCWEVRERWDMRREVPRCRRPAGEPSDEPRPVCRGDTALDDDRAVSRILRSAAFPLASVCAGNSP